MTIPSDRCKSSTGGAPTPRYYCSNFPKWNSPPVVPSALGQLTLRCPLSTWTFEFRNKSRAKLDLLLKCEQNELGFGERGDDNWLRIEVQVLLQQKRVSVSIEEMGKVI
ncbi:hypothetical protein CEXT_184941 [Caerostris extrusa]|uniref:Uncharacterized protein n=1 Tax=Caerostris extrusa TaxID=172846 RepID=A0AAV4T7R5_CAEEX|nr:hypothetical protein CEXT_184941 [Caerostris extrusa]